MHFNRNTLTETLEIPPYVLCKANGERIGIIPCSQEKTYDANFLEPDEIHFDTNLYINGERNEVYDEIDIWKYVEVPDIGLFVITQISTVAEGTLYESKSVEARSAESQELGQRYIEELAINTGETGSIDGVVFYSPGNPDYSLMHIIMGEKCYNWTFNHIDPELWTMKRSFDWSREAIYDILMEDISQAFECYFTFDSLHRQINAYRTMGKDTNILVTFNNLLEQTELLCDLDEIKTCLTITGSDDLTVREVNMSSDRILNLDYFHDRAYMSEGLYDAYTRWAQLPNTVMDEAFILSLNYEPKSDLRGKTYSQGFEILLDKYQDYYEDLHKEKSLNAPASYNERHLGYGDYYDPADPYNEAKVKHFDEYTHSGDNSGVLYVTSLPTTGQSTNILYIIKDSPTFAMYRWTGTAWFNVNIWTGYALNILNEQLKAAEKAQAVAMKAGYGNPEGDGSSSSTTQERKKKRYIDTYLPAYYTVEAINQQVPRNEVVITSLEASQSKIESDKNKIITKLSMENSANFTADQLKELNVFIREEELTSDNYIVTDEMTDDERFEMLHDMLDYGTKELAKIAQPQLSFSATLANLFTIPEFDVYSGDFDIGNYIWISIRDDYNIRAKLLTIHINFLEQTDFSATFGNIARTAKTMFTDIQDALNIATSAATSVSMNSSYWSEAAEEADSISDTIQKGLLSQGEYLKNGDDSELVMDSRGMFVTTISGDYAYKDSIFIGGGRVLFTNDDWKTVVMSVGRALIDYPYIKTNPDGTNIINKITESRFGVFADFLLAGYVGGSLIVGGDIYSDNYKGSSNPLQGNQGTHINLRNGTFVFSDLKDEPSKPGKQRLVLNDSGLKVFGIIEATEGHIGCDANGSGGFIIQTNKLYNNKTSFNDTHDGIYICVIEGISLGAYNSVNKRNPFSVTKEGALTSTSGYIGGFTIVDSSLYTNAKKTKDTNVDGVFLGNTGIGLGKTANYNGTTASKFQVNNDGSLYANNANLKGTVYANAGEIGSGDSKFIISGNHIYNGKTALSGDNAGAEGIYVGTDGIALGKNLITYDDNYKTSNFAVTKAGNLYANNANLQGKITATSGKIGGWNIGANSLTGGAIQLIANGNSSQIKCGENFSVDNNGILIAKSGTLENLTIKEGTIIAGKAHNNVWRTTVGDWAFKLFSDNIVLDYYMLQVERIQSYDISTHGFFIRSINHLNNIFQIPYDQDLLQMYGPNVKFQIYDKPGTDKILTFEINTDGKITTDVKLDQNSVLKFADLDSEHDHAIISYKDGVSQVYANQLVGDNLFISKTILAEKFELEDGGIFYHEDDDGWDHFTKGMAFSGDIQTFGNMYVGNIDNERNEYVYGTSFAYSHEPFSDKKLKKEIKNIPLQKAKDFIMSLIPKSFRFKNNPKRLHHGFIAQDVEKVAEWDVVGESADGMKSINYTEIIADLVSVVQDQEKRISELEAKLASLTK